MMKFHVISLFPEMIQNALQVGVIGQAIKTEKIKIEIYNPRLWCEDIHKTVDDRPFGGGDGMVMMAEPLARALDSIISQPISDDSKQVVFESSQELGGEPPLKRPRFLYLSPQGKTLNHELVMALSKEKEMVLLCGRYAGVDQRLLNFYQFEEISIGDFVISGGELGALVLIDAVGRQLEGVLGHENSSKEDSFAKEGLLEAPYFTRPREWKGQSVPSLFLTGHHSQIEEDRMILSLVVTFVKREDLFNDYLNKQGRHKSWKKILMKLSQWNQLSSGDLAVMGLSSKNLEDLVQRIQQFERFGN